MSEREKFELDRKEDPLDWRFVSSDLVNSSVTTDFDLVCILFVSSVQVGIYGYAYAK